MFVISRKVVSNSVQTVICGLDQQLVNMMTSSSSNFSENLHDPSTVLQRPTSAKTPDVSHILTSVFGEAFTKDVLTTDLIKNLTVSSDVDDQYHKRYVQRLKDVSDEPRPGHGL